jgi:monoamine oxidase
VAQDPSLVQAQTAAFLADFDKIYPGASTTASREASGKYRASMMSWPRNPWSQASYTCYRPGQFTGIAGNEGKPVGNLKAAILAAMK